MNLFFDSPRLRAKYLAWLCLLCTATISVQAQSGLTLEKALNLAQTRSQTLQAKDAAMQASQHMAVLAAQLPDPVFKVGVNNLPVTGQDRYKLTPDFMTMRSMGLMQEWVRSDKRQALSTRYQREAQAVQAQRRMSEQDIQRETAQAWLMRYYQQRMHEVLRQQCQEAQLQIQSVEALYGTGKATQSDVLSARLALAQIKDQLVQSQRQIEVADIQLKRWIGEFEETSLAELPDMQNAPWQNHDLHRLNEAHPHLLWMQRMQDVAQAELDLAQANRKANWTVEVMFNKRAPEFSDMVSLNFSLPLQWRQSDVQEREVAAKTAVVSQLKAERAEAAREHTAHVEALVQEWQSNRARVAEFEALQLPLAKERIQSALTAYRANANGLSDVLQARRMALDTQMEHQRLSMQTALLWAQLNYLTPNGN
jgi:outer membrane protein TolC